MNRHRIVLNQLSVLVIKYARQREVVTLVLIVTILTTPDGQPKDVSEKQLVVESFVKENVPLVD